MTIHVHYVAASVLATAIVTECDGDTITRVIAASERGFAERIAVLLERHGFTDVPDDASTLTTGWPAPDPNRRVG